MLYIYIFFFLVILYQYNYNILSISYQYHPLTANPTFHEQYKLYETMYKKAL